MYQEGLVACGLKSVCGGVGRPCVVVTKDAVDGLESPGETKRRTAREVAGNDAAH